MDNFHPLTKTIQTHCIRNADDPVTMNLLNVPSIFFKALDDVAVICTIIVRR